MTRELSFSYQGVTIGGNSSPGNTREITDYFLNTKRFEEFRFEAEFYIHKTTEADFASEIATIEAAFSKPFGDLVITQGSQNLYSYKQSDNTGLDIKPEILKREDKGSGRHRLYRVRLTGGLPANTGAESVTGLREHTVEVAYDPARIRTVTITGIFTAVGSNSSRAQYEAQISSLESSVFTALSISAANRELAEEPTADHTYNTKTISFRRIWRELIFSQGGSSNDDSGIKRQVLQISIRRDAPGDAPTIRRLASLTIQYDAWLDKTVSTDWKSKYNAIRSWIINQAKTQLGGGSVALVTEEPNYIMDENRISARLSLFGTTGGTVLEQSITIEDEFQPGWVLVPAWTGDVLSKYDYQGPATFRRTFTDTKTVPGFVYVPPVELNDAGGAIMSEALLGGILGGPPGDSYHHMQTRPTIKHRRMGRDGYVIDVTDITKIDVFEFFKKVEGIVGTATPGGGDG